jgi:hypothetical protein
MLRQAKLPRGERHTVTLHRCLGTFPKTPRTTKTRRHLGRWQKSHSRAVKEAKWLRLGLGPHELHDAVAFV